MAVSNTQNPFAVRLHAFDSPEARSLISALDEELVAVYPDFLHLVKPELCGNPVLGALPGRVLDANSLEPTDNSNNGTGADPVQDAELIFFVASTTTASPEAIGCIATRPLSTTTYPFLLQAECRDSLNSTPPRFAELKRLFIMPSYRKAGVAQALYETAEAHARDKMGVDVLVIETGVRQDGAVRLYERNGFVRRMWWGSEGRAVERSVEWGGVSLWMEKVLKGLEVERLRQSSPGGTE